MFMSPHRCKGGRSGAHPGLPCAPCWFFIEECNASNIEYTDRHNHPPPAASDRTKNIRCECWGKIVNKSSSLSVVMQAWAACLLPLPSPLATWNKFSAITLIQRAIELSARKMRSLYDSMRINSNRCYRVTCEQKKPRILCWQLRAHGVFFLIKNCILGLC